MREDVGTEIATPEKTAIRPLIWLVSVALAVPALIFAYGAWSSYQKLEVLVDERIERTLDILQEHALKVFQTTERLLYEADLILSSMSDDEIGAREGELSGRLKEIQQAVPEVQAIWAFDKEGNSLVSSTIVPVFQKLNNSDRDYFKQLQDRSSQLFVDKNVKAKVGDLTFFVISRPRSQSGSSFNGIVALTLPPTSLDRFYEKLARGSAIAAGLFRADGSALARYPTPPGGLTSARTNGTFLNALSQAPEGGVYTTRSGVDGTDRIIAYRKLPGYPVYVTAAYEQAAVWREWLNTLTQMLAFGLPAILFLTVVSWLVLKRTTALIREYDRRQQAESALKQSQRLEALGQLTGGVAHDFNNLLMVVRGNAERLLRLNGLAPKQTRAVQSIIEASGHGEKLTRQLLTFSRKQPINAQVVNLRERVPQLDEMLTTALRRQVQLSFDFPEELWNVEVNAADLDLAILNLAVNARDAMPEGGELVIGARNAPGAGDGIDRVELIVRDNGNGIHPAIIDRIFDPFFTTKASGKGTGLGLSQVYGLAKQVGGTVDVKSEPGVGTEFVIRFPRCQKPASSTTDQFDDQVVRPLRILLVEDNLAIADVTKANLESDGHQVKHSPDGDAALQAVQSETFDVVFSDIVMPGEIDGIELARRLRSSSAPPVLLATGYSEQAEKATAGGFTIIAKPYSIVTLRRELARIAPS